MYRNFGILVAFILFFMCTYLVAAEYIATDRSKGEVLVFRRGQSRPSKTPDEEAGQPDRVYEAEKISVSPAGAGGGRPTKFEDRSVFHWKDVCYDITIKNKDRRILDRVGGWVKPGTLTALMVSNS